MVNSSVKNRYLSYLALAATGIAFVVVLLGAYTRLRDAGLGCPDWPGCYGQLRVPETTQELQKAAIAFPHLAVESVKAWAEMVHRYVAGTLVFFILTLAIIAIARRRVSGQPVLPPLLLVALAVFQALLGMWTVTLLLYPPVVMGHLLGGMAIIALLWWTSLCLGGYFQTPISVHDQRFRPWALGGLIIVIIQIALGGWTSANYAGPSCPDFPVCQGQWLPALDLRHGFDLFMPVGANFQGGTLDNIARVTIHVVHRLGALITFLYVGLLALTIMIKAEVPLLKKLAGAVILLLVLQVSLGISLVLWHFPLNIAVAHNGVAALLLLAVVALNSSLYSSRSL